MRCVGAIMGEVVCKFASCKCRDSCICVSGEKPWRLLAAGISNYTKPLDETATTTRIDADNTLKGKPDNLRLLPRPRFRPWQGSAPPTHHLRAPSRHSLAAICRHQTHPPASQPLAMLRNPLQLLGIIHNPSHKIPFVTLRHQSQPLTHNP